MSAALNPAIASIQIPERMKKLPVDERGFPVPYFVSWIDGKPEFRVMDPGAFARCIKERACWLCGETLGANMAFVLGPMCAVNKVNSEPPSHLDCALYAARACPFLSRPHAKRRELDLPGTAGYQHAAGLPILRNPGAVAVWVTKSYEVVKVDNGILFDVGPPLHVFWYCEGRTARRAEVIASIDSGLPILEDTCKMDKDPAAARAALKQMYLAVVKLVNRTTVV